MMQLLKQPSNYIKSYYSSSETNTKIKNMFTFYKKAVLINWILMATIISHCFASSLLITYFKVKPVKVVQTLDDVLNDQNINVAGYSSALFLNNSIEKNKFTKLFKNMQEYEKKMKISELTNNMNNDFINKQILSDVLGGKAVLLVNTLLRYKMMDRFFNYELHLADSKYLQVYLAYKMTKNSKFSDKITLG